MDDRAEEPAYLYLTTTGRRSGLPREIEIWFTQWQGRFYVIAEQGERAQWVRNLGANPRVRWRVAKEAFAGLARVIDPAIDPDLHAVVQARSGEKYGWGDGLVVELAPDPRAD
jgi:deazaflavin-dependent oxidoreductase (nitroreductase family)